MDIVSNENLKEVKGGAINWTAAAGVGAFLSFIIGIIDGYINPKKCNN